MTRCLVLSDGVRGPHRFLTLYLFEPGRSCLECISTMITRPSHTRIIAYRFAASRFVSISQIVHFQCQRTHTLMHLLLAVRQWSRCHRYHILYSPACLGAGSMWVKFDSEKKQNAQPHPYRFGFAMHTCVSFPLPHSLCRPPHHTWTDFSFSSFHIVCTECYRTEDEQQPPTEIVNKNNSVSTIDINLFEHFMHSTHELFWARKKKKDIQTISFLSVDVFFSSLFSSLRFSFFVFSISFLHRKMKKFRFL